MKRTLIYILTILFFIGCEKEKSNEKEIISFSIDNIQGVMDKTNNTIVVNIPYNWDIRNLMPIIKVSKHAKISPASGEVQDFSKSIQYTLTAEDGSSQNYIVNVILEKNNQNDIIKFELKQKYRIYTGVLDNNANTVKFSLPFSMVKLDSLFTNILISDSATIVPSSGNILDFSNLTYTVKAQNGNSKDYTVIIQNNENYIRYFQVSSLENNTFYISTSNYWGPLYEEDYAGLGDSYIVTYVLSNVNISNICPQLGISERAKIDPPIGSVLDFNHDVSYSVTSETGESRVYKIRFIKRSIIFFDDFSPLLFNGVRLGDTPALWYTSISEIDSADFINIDTNEIFPCSVISYKSNYLCYTDYAQFYPIGKNFIIGSYQLKVYLKSGETILTHCKISIW